MPLCFGVHFKSFQPPEIWQDSDPWHDQKMAPKMANETEILLSNNKALVLASIF